MYIFQVTNFVALATKLLSCDMTVQLDQFYMTAEDVGTKTRRNSNASTYVVSQTTKAFLNDDIGRPKIGFSQDTSYVSFRFMNPN